MISTGWLDHRNDVYWPANAGWDFVRSNKIYTNIAATPFETAIIDADTGKTIASVATLDRAGGGVKIAGKSYEVLREARLEGTLFGKKANSNPALAITPARCLIALTSGTPPKTGAITSDSTKNGTPTRPTAPYRRRKNMRR